MATPRKNLVNFQSSGFYHCTSRCVRRAFLCGIDKETGFDYSHRKNWIERRIFELSKLFSVDIYAYAVMSNHYHIVLYIDPRAPQLWSDETVAEHWLKIYPGKNCPERRAFRKQAILNSPDKLKTYRSRLGNLSWFMSRLNEPLATMSNLEDNCSGKFWESRFTSQALLDEGAIFSCMAYVDLNPVRARITQKLKESNHTSIKARINKFRKTPNDSMNEAISAITGKLESKVLYMKVNDYLELVEWTGIAIVHPNKAAIPKHIQPVIERLNLQPKHWLKQIADFHQHYVHFVGPVQFIRSKAQELKLRCMRGISSARRFYTAY